MTARAKLTQEEKDKVRCQVLLDRVEQIVRRARMIAGAVTRRAQSNRLAEAGHRADARVLQARDAARRARKEGDVPGVRSAREDAREAEREAVAALREVSEGG